MAEIFSINDAYSTTRRVTKTPPEFDGVLLYPENVKQGGLRTKGLFKRSEADKPLITIVTVVYNGAEFLEETIKSVINQTYANVEYIVVDGGSTDGTLDILKRYEHYIDYWISEKDAGIYNAMNKSLSITSGIWINFMNAGDRFHKIDVLEQCLNYFLDEQLTVLYGSCKVMYPNKKSKVVKPGSVHSLWKGSQFCHQSTFTKNFRNKLLFNENEKIISDYLFFLEIYNRGLSFKEISIVICDYAAGGVSDKKRIDVIVAFWHFNSKTFKVNFYYITRLILEMFKTLIKKFVYVSKA